MSVGLWVVARWFGLVDPRGRWQRRRLGGLADEAVGAVLVGAGQDGGAGGADLGGAAVVDVGWR